MNIRNSLSALAVYALSATASSAAIIGFTGDVTQIAAPASVNDTAPGDNTNMLTFNELQGFTLLQDLVTDGGVISAGTTIDSHMVLLNRNDSLASLLVATGTVSFSGGILGTISDINGTLLEASNYLGAPGTTYQGAILNQGIESNDSLSFLGNTLSATLQGRQPGDWVRVVTAVNPVPLPAGMVLLLTGLGGLGLARRRNGRADA